ncbi:MAG: sulfite exporter TauE/SafE family protein [Armatimonadetes bacterium]|nr:sulfite exporter TauE/SafE family protein [Armatimonadota bacterium]
MHDALQYVVVGLIIFLTHFQEGITGFGCTVLALPFVTLLIGLDQAVPILVVQAWVLAGLIVIESRRHISWPQYGRIVGLVALGLPVGIWGATALPEHKLRWVLAGFMVVVGLQGLLRERRVGADVPDALDAPARAPWWAQALLPLGGLIQGAFGSGGPLVVVYAARALTHKSVFRATLCMLWLTLNTIMISTWIIAGRFDTHLITMNAAYLPATLIGLWLGNHAHYRINEHLFRQVVYAVLMLSGVVLVWSLLK